MTKTIRVVIEFKISAGKLVDVKKTLNAAIETTKAKDTGALGYEFFFNNDESALYALETYKDSAAVLSHFALIGDLLNELMANAQPSRMEVFGEPSDELAAALEPFSPSVFKHWGGFTR